MKTKKYSLDSGITIWKIYHYFGMNEFTGKKDYIQHKGFNTQAETWQNILKIIQAYDTKDEIRKSMKFRIPKTKSSIRESSLDNSILQVLLTWKNYQLESFLKLGMNVNSSEQIIFTSLTNNFIGDNYLKE